MCNCPLCLSDDRPTEGTVSVGRKHDQPWMDEAPTCDLPSLPLLPKPHCRRHPQAAVQGRGHPHTVVLGGIPTLRCQGAFLVTQQDAALFKELKNDF